MKKLLPLLLLLLAAHCTKKKFEKTEGTSLILTEPGKKAELVREPMKKDLILWENKAVKSLKVDGFLRVTYKDNDFFYLQLICPAELKCNGKYVYVPRGRVLAEEKEKLPFAKEAGNPASPDQETFLLVPDSNLEKTLAFRDWLESKDKKEPPVAWNGYLLQRKIRAAEDPFRELSRYYHLLYAMVNRTPAAPGVLDQKEFGFVDKGTVLASGENLNNVFYLLQNRYQAEIGEKVTMFPFAEKSDKKLADYLNKISQPFLKGFIIREIVSVPYRLQFAESGEAGEPGPPAAEEEVKTTVRVLFKEGITFLFSGANGGGNPQLSEATAQADQIRAFAAEDGIGFEFKTEKGTIRLEPTAASPYLASGRPEAIKKLVKELPSDDDIVAENPPDLALMKLTLKYGTGELNKETGKFEYEVDLSKKKVFWSFVKAVKKRQEVEDDGVFTGEIKQYSETKKKLLWYQKYDKNAKIGSFGLQGTAVECGRGECSETPLDVVCFRSDSTLRAAFYPAMLGRKSESDHSGSDLAFIGDESMSVCQHHLGIFYNSEENYIEEENRFVLY